MMNFVYWVRGAEHAELCDLSIRSVRRVYPQARVHVYTDESNGWRPDGLLYRTDGGMPPMLAREYAKVQAAMTLPYGENVWFLDSDILLQKPLPVTGEVDFYVTYREHTNVNKKGERIGQQVAAVMPFNGGVVGARIGPRAIEALMWCKVRMLKMCADRRVWWGDQLALMELVGLSKPGIHERRIHWTLEDIGTPLRVQVLDGEMWNYTPDQDDEDLSERGVIHCKGDRKDLMRRLAA